MNYFLLMLCFFVFFFSYKFGISDLSLSYSLSNDDANRILLKNESIKIVGQINIENIPNISIINNNHEIELVETNKELLVEEFVNNKSNSSLESTLNEDKLPWIKKSPWVNNKWYGLDIYSAAEKIEIREENRSLIRPINPPDISIAVGKEHVLQMVHSAVQIWKKSGEPIMKKAMHDFFNISKDHYITDPVVLYDKSIGKWFAAVVDGGILKFDDGFVYPSCLPDGCKVTMVVSKTEDPTKDWTVININSKSYFPDLPKIAVSEFYLVVATKNVEIEDKLPYLNESNAIPTVYIMKKNSIDDQDIASTFLDSIPFNKPQYPIQDIDRLKCSSMISLNKINSSDLYSPVNSVEINDYCYGDWGPSVFGLNKIIDIPRLDPAPDPAPFFKQPLVINSSTINDKRQELEVLSALRDRDFIWIALHSACQPDSISNYSCINILKFAKIKKIINGNPEYAYELHEYTQFHINNTDVYYPAISVTKDGKLLFISGFSNQNTFPSLIISHLVSENQTSDKVLVFGSASSNSARYGDYFGSAIDPVNGTVWLSGQYVDESIPVPSNLSNKETDVTEDKTWSTIIVNVS